MPGKKKVILVLDGESGQALRAVRCLRQERIFEIHVVSRISSAPIRLSRHVKSFNFIDKLESDEKYLSRITTLISDLEVDLVFPILERSVALLIAHRARFENLCSIAPIPDAKTFETATDKRLLGQFMFEHGIPAPGTTVLDGVHGNFDTIKSLSFPMLAKPGKGGFGRDIHRFDSLSELTSFLEDPKVTCADYAIQPFIVGADVECSVICKDGQILAHTIQHTIIESKRTFGPPTGIEFVEDPEVLEIVRQLMFLLRWQGVAHIDLRRDEFGRYNVLEINARYWGSLLGSLAAGVNFPLLSAQIALAQSPDKPTARKTRYGVGPLGFQKRRAQMRAGILLANTVFPHMIKDRFPMSPRRHPCFETLCDERYVDTSSLTQHCPSRGAARF
ncbi:MAG: ATP-grasp domain-containing protein [Rhodothermales bacterium]|nr:ATP-grasp domain-containing protein [Rhodothermales bacterium]